MRSMDDEQEEFTDTNSISFTGGSSRLEDYSLSEGTLQTLKRQGIETLFPVQVTCFEPVSAGTNVIAKDRTGSGKTLAYALPLLERLRREGLFRREEGQRPYLLVIVPTRELAMQITTEFLKLSNSRDEFALGCFFGGVTLSPQHARLRSGVEVVVATPGRLLALLSQGALRLDEIRTVVLDETDMMLDMGFKDEIEKVFRNLKRAVEGAGRDPEQVQHLLFSATMPSWVREISRSFMGGKYVFVDMLKDQTLSTPASLRHVRVRVSSQDEQIALVPKLIKQFCSSRGQCIVFTDTRQRAREVYASRELDCSKAMLQGDVSPSERRRIFTDFKANRIQCLVATNLASRGLDFPHVELVVMLSPPDHYTTYVHRAGRAGRAGREGVCATCYLPQQIYRLESIALKASVDFEEMK